MGADIKADLARLVTLAAAAYQFLAAIVGCFNPKVFFDFVTRSLDGIVAPFPALQLINMALSVTICALEWPLGKYSGPVAGGSAVIVRILLLALAIIMSIFMYQATNAALYYSIALGIYVSVYRTHAAKNTRDPGKA